MNVERSLNVIDKSEMEAMNFRSSILNIQALCLIQISNQIIWRNFFDLGLHKNTC